jgi:hypothetical protein
MKLQHALVLGLTTAVLAIPAFAADDATNLPAAGNTDQKAPVKKEMHKKGHQHGLSTGSAATKTEKSADLNKLVDND